MNRQGDKASRRERRVPCRRGGERTGMELRTVGKPVPRRRGGGADRSQTEAPPIPQLMSRKVSLVAGNGQGEVPRALLIDGSQQTSLFGIQMRSVLTSQR